MSSVSKPWPSAPGVSLDTWLKLWLARDRAAKRRSLPGDNRPDALGRLQGASPSGEVVFQRRAVGKCESQSGCVQEFGQYARNLGSGRIDSFRDFSVKPKL